MANVDKALFVASGVAGVLGVALGAFGAHGLRDYFASLADGEARRRLWETAAHYHLLHAVALGVAASLARKEGVSTVAFTAGLSFIAGIALFSGSLYAMALTGVRALGVVTPFGGVAFIAGWASIAVAAFRLR